MKMSEISTQSDSLMDKICLKAKDLSLSYFKVHRRVPPEIWPFVHSLNSLWIMALHTTSQVLFSFRQRVLCPWPYSPSGPSHWEDSLGKLSHWINYWRKTENICLDVGPIVQSEQWTIWGQHKESPMHLNFKCAF